MLGAVSSNRSIEFLRRRLATGEPISWALRSTFDTFEDLPDVDGCELGPQTVEIYDVFNRLDRLPARRRRSAQDVADRCEAAERGAADSYSVWRAVRRSGQPEERVLKLLELAPHLQVPDAGWTVGAGAIERGIRAVVGAHFLSAVEFNTLVRPLEAVIGTVPYPRTALAQIVPLCGGPVGAHLLTAAHPKLHCVCPIPGLTATGARIARSLAPDSTNWTELLQVASLLDPSEN